MKKLIVFSADAMVSEDLEHLKELPNYRRYLSDASEVTRVRSIYPTITYFTYCCTFYSNFTFGVR